MEKSSSTIMHHVQQSIP